MKCSLGTELHPLPFARTHPPAGRLDAAPGERAQDKRICFGAFPGERPRQREVDEI